MSPRPDPQAVRDALAAARAALEMSPPSPLRSIHHFACSGGTLMTKCLGALPNVVTLSEIDPLSRLQLSPPDRPQAFAPTDLIRGLRHATRSIDEAVLVDIFTAGLRVAHQRLSPLGQHLLLRDHAHSQFCTLEGPASRPTLHAILSADFPLLSVLTLRHPLDSFLSLRRNGWVHFRPNTLEEYCQRYMLFLDSHAGVPQIKYEAFVADPQAVLAQMAALLDLRPVPGAMDLLDMVQLSGDSGRSGKVIAPRPRRPLPADLAREQQTSPAYAALCARLGYEA